MPYLVVLSGYLGLSLAALTMIHGYFWANSAVAFHFLAAITTCILICYFEVGWLFMILAMRSGLSKKDPRTELESQLLSWLRSSIPRWTLEIVASLLLFSIVLLSGGATHTGFLPGGLHGVFALTGFVLLVWIVYRQEISIFSLQEKLSAD